MRLTNYTFGKVDTDILVSNAAVARIPAVGGRSKFPILQMHRAFGRKIGHRLFSQRRKKCRAPAGGRRFQYGMMINVERAEDYPRLARRAARFLGQGRQCVSQKLPPCNSAGIGKPGSQRADDAIGCGISSELVQRDQTAHMLCQLRLHPAIGLLNDCTQVLTLKPGNSAHRLEQWLQQVAALNQMPQHGTLPEQRGPTLSVAFE